MNWKIKTMLEPQPTVLLIEDEPQIRRFVRASMEAEGWQVFETESKKRGVIEAGTRKPDLIILDLGLPDGDGLKFLAELSAQAETKRRQQ